ncbi:MAG TPA: MFS transporter, partial [Candidatus Limnocylindria bacterium]
DNISWHWIFFVNIPLGLIVLVVIWRVLPTHRDPNATRNIDYLGASLLVAALVPILIGFTQKQFGEWTDPDVGGLIALGLVMTAAFVWAESRAKDPILPLHLFRIRYFTASVMAMFFAAVGFFAAVVFLPRWFQVVNGSSATESGYQILPLLGGLIVAAVVSGQIVARTGRYKPIIFGSLLVLAGGLFLLTNMRPDTDLPVVWLWMAITGLGIGPAFAVFTLVVQNNVPVRELGTGTSSVTLFQQVGGTVGLAITGSLFTSVLLEEIPNQLEELGVPPEFAGQLAGGDALNNLAGVGDLGAAILAQVPPAFQAQVEPFIPAIVNAIHVAFSIATSATFSIGVVTSLLAAAVVLVWMPGGRMGEPSEATAPSAPSRDPEPATS